ncbi:MAG: hypothetical protein ABL962_09940 [Fimbriimonadaceae bacterium]
MKRYALLATTAAIAGTVAFQGSVNLQATTPGTAQTGHLNITGTAKAGAMVGYSSTPTGQTFGGDFRATSTEGRGVLGNASSPTGATYGGLFQSFSNAGRGIAGIAVNSAGTTYGGFFSSLSNQGRGVYGQATSLSGLTYGVYGRAVSPGGFGVYSEGHMHVDGNLSIGAPSTGDPLSVSTGSVRAIRALATSTGGVTVTGHFSNASDSGVALFGEANSATGSPYGVRGYSQNGIGVHGQSNSPTGFGIYSEGNMTATGIISGNGSGLTSVNADLLDGLNSTAFLQSVPNPLHLVGSTSGEATIEGENTNINGWGVRGETTSATGTTYGLLGVSLSSSGRGVYGAAGSATGTIYGVYGLASTSAGGFAIYASGDMGASGVKPFRIDHPYDPENKYLLHYAAESPMPQNFYVGNVVTDSKGYAWVELPDYFDEINKNFKYQLTVVENEASPNFVQVKIGREIRDGRFLIMSNAPKVKVSWEVKADRNDLYVRNRPPKDVVAKEGPEKGTYQHPEFYNLGPERGMNYNPAMAKKPIKPKK